MSAIPEKQKASQVVTPYLYVIIIGAIAGYLIAFATPIMGEVPVEVTEDLEILGVTEKGVVVETSTGVALVTSQYDGEPGDIIKVTYSVPAKYLDEKLKQHRSFIGFHPDS